VFNDLNGNGVQDGGENGLSGVTITLRNGEGTAIATTTTVGDGSYQFTNVSAGSYTVEETDPSGFVSTTPNTVSTTVAAGGAANANFGDRISPAKMPRLKAIQIGTLSGDKNGNGAANPGDTLLYTVQITNTGTADATSVVFTDTPDPNTTLVVGSVQSTGGTVKSGNDTGNTMIVVDIGTLPVGASVTITYSVLINDPFPEGITSISNQATITSAELAPTLTDDPSTTKGGDPTQILVSVSPTAISLTSFTATQQGNTVIVRWATSSEINTWGFYLLRSSDGKRIDAVRVTPEIIPSQERGPSGAAYQWNDTNVAPGTTYTYWLEQVEVSGATHEYGPAKTSGQTTSTGWRLFVPLMTK
jgi:uncharacterized repeat protein (TIGR01451 family)